MNSQVTPNKIIDLSDLGKVDMKTRRLFVLMDGNRSVAELAKLCHVEESECECMVQKLLSDGYINAVGFENNSECEDPSAGSLDGEPLAQSQKVECKGFEDCLTKELAKYIGPIAKLVVAKTEAKKGVLPVSKMQEIVLTVSTEIESEAEKDMFIEAMTERVQKKSLD